MVVVVRAHGMHLCKGPGLQMGFLFHVSEISSSVHPKPAIWKVEANGDRSKFTSFVEVGKNFRSHEILFPPFVALLGFVVGECCKFWVAIHIQFLPTNQGQKSKVLVIRVGDFLELCVDFAYVLDDSHGVGVETIEDLIGEEIIVLPFLPDCVSNCIESLTRRYKGQELFVSFLRSIKIVVLRLEILSEGEYDFENRI